MTVELKWVPTWESSDHRAKGWSEVLIHDGGCEEGHFLMASPVEEEPAQPEPAAPDEMPEAVDKACDLLEWGGNISAAAALRAAWRSQYAHAQPRPKLEKTRRALKCGQERLNIVFLSEETTTRWNNLFYEALAELDEWEGR